MSLCQDRRAPNQEQASFYKAAWFDALRSQKGGVIALVVLFLPAAVLSIGIVADLGVVFAARRLVQAACDLGALAGCQELDWDLLAQGTVFIDEARGKAKALEYTMANLEGMGNLLCGVNVTAVVDNSRRDEPSITVEAHLVVPTFFLRWLPGMEHGVSITVLSQSSVVERSEWD